MEQWDIYDADRIKTQRTHQRGQALRDGDYHLVVHVWILNSKGEFLLAKRHPNKPHPNLWECPGGSVLAGEDSLQGVLREVQEEIGISLEASNGRIIKTERRDNYQDFYDVWLFNQDFDIAETSLQQEEVIDIRWASSQEIGEMFARKQLVHTLSYFLTILSQKGGK